MNIKKIRELEAPGVPCETCRTKPGSFVRVDEHVFCSPHCAFNGKCKKKKEPEDFLVIFGESIMKIR